MGKFTKIPQNTFSALQLDAGILLKNFDPETAAEPADEDIITATTGGINATCIPTYSDLGEDVDNVPVNMKELKHLDSWACKLTTTGIGTSPELIRYALGAADISSATYAVTSDEAIDETKTYYVRSGTSPNYTYTKVTTPDVSDIATYYEMTSPGYKITPRRDLKQTDFATIWWVGDRADGGMVAVKLMNALSTGGLSLQTTKNGKGQVSIELTGHVSINAQDVMPMEWYSADPVTSEP